MLVSLGGGWVRSGWVEWDGGALACAVLGEVGAEVDSGVGSRAAVGLALVCSSA